MRKNNKDGLAKRRSPKGDTQKRYIEKKRMDLTLRILRLENNPKHEEEVAALKRELDQTWK